MKTLSVCHQAKISGFVKALLPYQSHTKSLTGADKG
jgi:hypothetical protein